MERKRMIQISQMTDAQLRELCREHDRLNPTLEVSQDVIDTLKRYIEKGIPTGGFLEAVLSNDLFGAMARADSYNRASLFFIVQYIYNNLPIGSYGSRKNVERYLSEFSHRAENFDDFSEDA